MKRTNEQTGRPFRRGDVRHDGYIFFAYTKRLRADGYVVEIWLRPEASQRALDNDRRRHQQRAHGNRGHDARANP